MRGQDVLISNDGHRRNPQVSIYRKCALTGIDRSGSSSVDAYGDHIESWGNTKTWCARDAGKKAFHVATFMWTCSIYGSYVGAMFRSQKSKRGLSMYEDENQGDTII